MFCNVMASKIAVQRVCERSGEAFVAKTTVTRFCSDYCAKRAYKTRKRKAKIEGSNLETGQKIQWPILEIQAKEFFSVADVCVLFSVGPTTVWRLCKSGKIKSVKIGRRRFIKRSAIDKLFEG